MVTKLLKKLFLFPFLLLQACFSRFSGDVDKSISDSYYYAKGSGKIVYSPMGNWFSLGCTKMDADPVTFKPIARDFGKDKSRMFYKSKPIPQAELATFVVEKEVIKDAKHVYAIRDYDEITIVKKADPDSYRYLDSEFPRSKRWAKDDFHYFLYDQKVEVDYVSFRILENELLADKNFIYVVNYEDSKDYIWGKPFLQQIDSVKGEIKAITPVYMRMNNSVYANHDHSGFRKIPFDQIENVKIVAEECIIVNETLLVKGEIFPFKAVDIASFENMDSFVYTCDKNHIYFQGQPLPNADVATFALLNGSYGKDKNKVYFLDSVLVGANPETFTYDEKRMEWTDGKAIYRGGNAFRE